MTQLTMLHPDRHSQPVYYNFEDELSRIILDGQGNDISHMAGTNQDISHIDKLDYSAIHPRNAQNSQGEDGHISAASYLRAMQPHQKRYISKGESLSQTKDLGPHPSPWQRLISSGHDTHLLKCLDAADRYEVKPQPIDGYRWPVNCDVAKVMLRDIVGDSTSVIKQQSDSRSIPQINNNAHTVDLTDGPLLANIRLQKVLAESEGLANKYRRPKLMPADDLWRQTVINVNSRNIYVLDDSFRPSHPISNCDDIIENDRENGKDDPKDKSNQEMVLTNILAIQKTQTPEYQKKLTQERIDSLTYPEPLNRTENDHFEEWLSGIAIKYNSLNYLESLPDSKQNSDRNRNPDLVDQMTIQLESPSKAPVDSQLSKPIDLIKTPDNADINRKHRRRSPNRIDRHSIVVDGMACTIVNTANVKLMTNHSISPNRLNRLPECHAKTTRLDSAAMQQMTLEAIAKKINDLSIDADK